MYTLRTKLGKGFTLIELLIVITIIGILAVALVPKITGAPAAARDTARKTNINSLAVTIQSYINDNGGYPPTQTLANAKKGGLPECLATASSVAGPLLIKYLNGNVMINDPMKNRSIDYGVTKCTSGQYYYIPLKKTDTDDSIVGYLLGAYLEGTGGNNVECFATSTTPVATCDSANDTIKTDGSNTKGYIQYEVTS